MKRFNIILLVLIVIVITGCAGFDTPRLPVPFVVLETNAIVNQTPYLDDNENYGQEDYWATPREFYNKSRGDCEDYAIAKYFALRDAGIPASRMRLVVGEIDDGDGVHMVLFVKYKETFVLDNIVQRVTPLTEYIDFDIMYSFNEDGVYFSKSIGRASISYLPKWKDVINKMHISNK